MNEVIFRGDTRSEAHAPEFLQVLSLRPMILGSMVYSLFRKDLFHQGFPLLLQHLDIDHRRLTEPCIEASKVREALLPI